MTAPREQDPQGARPDPPAVSTSPPRSRWRWRSHVGPARSSTVLLAVAFVAIGFLYLGVRDPSPGRAGTPTDTSPATEAPADPAPSEEAPAEDAPTEDPPTGDAPATDAPTTSPGSPRTTTGTDGTAGTRTGGDGGTTGDAPTGTTVPQPTGDPAPGT